MAAGAPPAVVGGRSSSREQPGATVSSVKILHSILGLLERIVTLPFRLVRGLLPGGRKPRP